MKQTDIAIAGGGIAGLTLAALLGGAGISIAVIDPKQPPAPKDIKPSGRTVALMENSLNIIKAAGVWEKIQDQCTALKTMRIIDDSMAGQKPLDSEFHAADIGLEQFGFNIPNGLLHAALFEKVQKLKSVTLHIPATLADCTPPSPDLHYVKSMLEDGTEIQSKLLIGADGRNSAVREISSIQTRAHQYDQNAITCLINHSKSHDNISTEFHRPAGPLALVPLPGNQSSVVWVEKPGRAEEIIRLKKSEFEQLLQERTNNILGGITLEAGPDMWPLSTLQAKSLTAPRVALMAEAAHVMSPITAQGLNLSLRDVAALAETIVDAMRLGLDPGTETILKKYEARRRIDIKTRIYGVDGMNRIVSNDVMALKGLRRAGFKTLDALPPLKNLAMRHGLAPQIDASRLAKGEAL